VDEALRTLDEVRSRYESQGRGREAAEAERRRAELLRDARRDLDAADASLERSFQLSPELATVQLGASLAESRRDVRVQARWLERAVAQTQGKPRAQALLALARALSHDGSWPARADAAAREALSEDPSLREAESLLLESLEGSGKLEELAAYFEEAAERAKAADDRVALLVRAADVYGSRLGRHDAAAGALLAAHASAPADQTLTARAADTLHAAGRADEAAEFDALLLETNPFHRVAGRHLAYLETHKDHAARAGFMLKRASAQKGAEAAHSFLLAAEAFRAAGAAEQALLSEDQAFAHDPGNAAAFASARTRHAGEVRKLAEVLERRARAVPDEAPALLRERAQRLADAGEELLAAGALDELLALAPDDLPALLRRGDLAAAAGGPQAAQPYDRRGLAVGGEELAAAVRVKLQLRLGHAALQSGAFRDAADALEAVVALDADGERGQEALSLLAEVHARTQNLPGLYRTSLALARKARPDEAEALLRRAAGLFTDPREAVDAWLLLAQLRPAEAAVVEKATQALRALGRVGELVELLERSAEAAGGSRGAELLLEAATLTSHELSDDAKARALKMRAFRAEPDHPAALRAVVEEARLRGDSRALREALERLIPQAEDQDDEALWRLELASAAQQDGDLAAARDALWTVVRWGRAATGYSEALQALLPLLSEEEDPRVFADVLSQLAEVSSGPERSELLLQAGGVLDRIGDAAGALRMTQAAVLGQPSSEGFGLLAKLYRQAGEHARAAEVLRQAARLLEGEPRGRRLLEAADAFEAAGAKDDALECTEEAAQLLGAALPPLELAQRLTRLGAFREALAAGFTTALTGGDLEGALALAQGAGDEARTREVLAAEAAQGGSSLAQRLVDARIAAGDGVGLLRLASTLDEVGADKVARVAWDQLLFGAVRESSSVGARRMALERLLPHGNKLELLTRALEVADPTEGGWGEWLLERARTQGDAVVRGFLPLLAERLPARRDEFRLQLADLHERAQDLAGAVAVLVPVVEGASPDAAGPLWLRLAGLHERLGSRAQALVALEGALNSLASAPAAAEKLLALAGTLAPEALLHAAERVTQAGQAAALAPHQAALADAYEGAGKLAEAARALSELEPTRERLERRAALAEKLGHSGEALTLREQLTDDPRALEEILLGYLVRDLHPPAVRLTQRLLKESALSPRAHRAAAERLSRTPEGAELASALWPALLRERPVDVDGWTLFAEALRRAGRTAPAANADGLGAALAGTGGPSSIPALRPVVRGGAGVRVPLPEGALPVGAEVMPRLARALEGALSALGAPSVKPYLDPRGGPEAYLVGEDALVVGAGALALFGPAEVTYLCALALALGEQGASLREPGPVAPLAGAVAAALQAAPGTLAAARVVAALDPAVRGAAPGSWEVTTVLRNSELFPTLARAALELG
jgi:tetratricopeptide (TPR) repeat protein